MSDEVVYTSNVRIERVKGPLRRAFLPGKPEPVFFGVHSEIAEHYNVDPSVHEPHTTTLDYLVAAAGGWLTGTFGGALEARKIPAGDGLLIAGVKGEIEKEGNVIVVKRIHVTYHLKTVAENRETVERVLSIHADSCPVAKTISGCVNITTSVEIEEI